MSADTRDSAQATGDGAPVLWEGRFVAGEGLWRFVDHPVQGPQWWYQTDSGEWIEQHKPRDPFITVIRDMAQRLSAETAEPDAVRELVQAATALTDNSLIEGEHTSRVTTTDVEAVRLALRPFSGAGQGGK